MTMTPAEVEATAWRVAHAATTAAATGTPTHPLALLAAEGVDVPPADRGRLLGLAFHAATVAHAGTLLGLATAGVDLDALLANLAARREHDLALLADADG